MLNVGTKAADEPKVELGNTSHSQLASPLLTPRTAATLQPQPRRLDLTPAHVAQFQHETKAPISFITARFNTGLDAAHQ